MADLLEQTMPELPIEGKSDWLDDWKKFIPGWLLLEASKKGSDRTGIDFYLPGRSEDVSVPRNWSIRIHLNWLFHV